MSTFTYYPPIIGINGDFECGKDAAGSILVRTYGYTRVAFGDFVKDTCLQFVSGRTYPSDFPDDIQKIILKHCNDACAVIRKPTSPEIRRLLQFVGTDYYRKKDPDYWVGLFDTYARPILKGGGRVVAPDMRFDNEGAYVKECRGAEWQVIRPGLSDSSQREHRSERAYTRTPAVVIRNDGPLDLLNSRVIEALQTTQALYVGQAA